VNKSELQDHVAEKAGLSKADAGRAIDAMIDGITVAMKKDGSLSLVGFGSFKKTKRAARKGRNPRTGEEIQIKAANQVKFSAGSKLKDAVN
tara:strand:- start:3176 stop:3448 length:273 start_codon:yes stop_codon:yes gene_type:complete